MKKERKAFSKFYLGLLFLFFYLPIVYMIIFSFNESKSLSKFTGFSLQWYIKMLENNTTMEAIYYTVLVAVIATVVSTIVGTLASIGISNSKKILREAVLQINNLPLMNPDIVTAIGLMLFFSSLHISKGLGTLLLAHIAFCIPYVMLSVMPRIRRLDPNLAEAAMDLGAKPGYALIHVIIPQLMPGIIAGALTAFTMSFDDFVISYFVTGNGINNISIIVYSMAKRVNPTINAMSTLIVVAITIVLIVTNLVSRYNVKHNVSAKTTITRLAIVAVCVCVGLYGLSYMTNSSSSDFDPIAVYGCDTLNVFNAGEYVAEDTISNFEELYNVDVNYSIFASNEEMYTKVASGEEYDVIVPSDYMIIRMMQEGLLQEINLDNITNYSNLDPSVLNKSYDPDNTYSIPYMWGSIGILYDTTKVDAEDVESMGWEVLKYEKYAGMLYVYDNERDMFMIALKALGYSMNTDDEDEIYEAYEWLVELKQTMDPVFVTDEVMDGMINGEKAMAIVYSGDAVYTQYENENLAFWEPEEGTNIWTDSFVIPATSTCTELAEAFINYMLEYEVAYNNSYEVGYTSSVLQVELDLQSGEYAGLSSYVPRADYELDEEYNYDDDVKKLLAELYIKFKAS